MTEFPSLPLFTDAFLGDTTTLNVEETGAYLMLLIVSWRTEDCSLPDDDVRLARLARCTRKQWARIRPALEPFFTFTDSRWRQKRLIDEFNFVRAKRESAAANGRASALKRKGRHSTKRSANDIASDERSDEQSASLAMSKTPTPTTHTPLEEEGKKEEERNNPPPLSSTRARDGSEYAFAGRTIRLSEADLGRWREAYPTIDIRAELTSIDAWLQDHEAQRNRWFNAVSGMLNKRHQENVRLAREAAKPNPNEPFGPDRTGYRRRGHPNWGPGDIGHSGIPI